MNQSQSQLYITFMNKYIYTLSLIFIALQCFGQNKIEGNYNANYKLFETTDSTYHIDFFKNGVARIYQSGYIGLMDSTGLVLIQPKYNQIYDFEGDVAKVSLHRKVGLIDRFGNELIEPFAFEIEDFIDGFAKCKINYLETKIIDTQGNFINEFAYDYISAMNNGRFTFIRENNFGLLTPQGKELVVIENYDRNVYGDLVHYAHYGAGLVLDNADYCNLFEFNDGRAVTFDMVKGSIKFGCIDSNANIVVPIIFDRIEPFENGFAVVKQKNLWGVIDKNGKIILSCKYESVKVIDANHFIISKDEKYGIVNREGDTLLPVNYESIKMIPDNNFIVAKNNRSGVINEKEEILLKIDYPYLKYLFDGMFITNNGEKWGVVNYSGKKILSFNHDGIMQLNDSTGIASVHKSDFSLNTGVPRYVYNGEYSTFDTTGRLMNKNFPFSKTMEMVGDNHNSADVIRMGHNTFVPFSGFEKRSINKAVASDKYNFVQQLENGFKIVGVKKETPNNYNIHLLTLQLPSYTKGIINEKGEFVVPMRYDEIIYNSPEDSESCFQMVQCAPRNLFTVTLDGFQGVINLKNELVIPIEYDFIKFCSGIISLTKQTEGELIDGYQEGNYQIGIVDMNGKIIIPLEERSYGDDPLDAWISDEERGNN